MRRVIIAGGRDFDDYDLMESSLKEFERQDIEVVSGRAYGADRLGEKWANRKDKWLRGFVPNWQDMSEPCRPKTNQYGETYNALAGMKRNREMAEYAGKEGLLIAFWDGKSRGTKNMIDEARKVGMEVIIIKY